MKKYLVLLSNTFRLSLYDYLSKHPYPVWSQAWNFAPLFVVYISTYFFFCHFFLTPNNNFHLMLAIGLCCWNFFRESTGQASSIYTQKWKLIKNIPVNKYKLHLALTLSSFYSLLLHLLIVILLAKMFSPLSFDIGIKVLYPLCGLFITTYLFNLIVAPFCAIYRDGHQFWSLFLQVFIWFNPIFIPSTMLPEFYQRFLLVNPLGNDILNLYHALGLSETYSNVYFSLLTLSFLAVLAIFVTEKGNKNVVLSI